MKTEAELYSEVSRVIKMCEGTDVHWVHCIKCSNKTMVWPPMFDCLPEYYTFSLAIVESKPVFPGDRLWSTYTKSYEIITRFHCEGYLKTDRNNTSNVSPMSLLWEEPKKTITINGVELVAPSNVDNGHYIQFSGPRRLYWDDIHDRDNVEEAIISILEGK